MADEEFQFASSPSLEILTVLLATVAGLTWTGSRLALVDVYTFVFPTTIYS